MFKIVALNHVDSHVYDISVMYTNFKVNIILPTNKLETLFPREIKIIAITIAYSRRNLSFVKAIAQFYLVGTFLPKESELFNYIEVDINNVQHIFPELSLKRYLPCIYRQCKQVKFGNVL